MVLRKMVNISWKKKLANERVLQMAGENRRLLYTIQRRKIEHFGHVMRHNEMPRVIVEGKVEETKDKGRQGKMYLVYICIIMDKAKKEKCYY